MQGQEERKPQVSRFGGVEAQLDVMRELSYQLLASLGEMRRELRLARSMLEVDRGTPGGARQAVLEALAENDRSYSIMMKLRWTLLRRMDPVGELKLEGGSMNETNPMVFVVDDSASVRRALSRLLTSVGLQVETFDSAIRFLEQDLPDVPSCVVLDVRMPRMSGLDLQKEMADRGRDIPIVFITGHGDINMAVKAMKDGAVDFLPKPFNDQDLIDSINRALSGHQALRNEQAEISEIQTRADRLSPRERQVMELVITGMLNKQVAFDLGTSEKTVKVHRARVMEKMEAGSLAELVRLAARIGVDGPSTSPPTTS